MVVHQVSGTVRLGSDSKMLQPVELPVSVFVKRADSDNYNEVGRAMLIGIPTDAGVEVEPAAIPVLLRSIADAYEQAIAAEEPEPEPTIEGSA